MSDKTEQLAEFTALVERFVQLANEMKGAGKPLPMINAALMSASATYGTYVAAGNDGCLRPSGVDKVVDAYRNQVIKIQELKRQTIHSEGKDIPTE
ncbi:MAG: DUF3144 domain-containing protein [Candidatus Thiodiazotropha sp. (ex Epidulcina cf. delphinae)]|nr:DUF3144 domain-containing protein [Candidatus Thiodiazotropha sp. (ex Epidulcina cf. delphinae)]